MKLFKILALTLLAISTAIAAEDLPSSAGQRARSIQASRLGEQPELLGDLKSAVMRIVNNLIDESTELKKQLGQLSGLSIKALHLTSFPHPQETSFQEETLGIIGADFVHAIFEDLRRTVLGIISALEQENTVLKELLAERKGEQIAFQRSCDEALHQSNLGNRSLALACLEQAASKRQLNGMTKFITILDSCNFAVLLIEEMKDTEILEGMEDTERKSTQANIRGADEQEIQSVQNYVQALVSIISADPTGQRFLQFVIGIAESFFDQTTLFMDHIEIVKFFNTKKFGIFSGSSTNFLFNPEFAQKCLDKILERIKIRDEYYLHASGLVEKEMGRFSGCYQSPVDPTYGPIKHAPILLKKVAEIGTPWQKFHFAEREAKRFPPDCTFVPPSKTREEIAIEERLAALQPKFAALQTKDEQIKFYDSVFPLIYQERIQRDVEDNFAPPLSLGEGLLFGRCSFNDSPHPPMPSDLDMTISDFIRRGIKENAEVIGPSFVPKVKKSTDIDVLLLSSTLEPLREFYKSGKEKGTGYTQFWLEVKRLLEQKSIRFLRTVNFEQVTTFQDTERNQWYSRAVAQIIEEQDPEALNYYRVLKLEHGSINLTHPFSPQRLFLSLPHLGCNKAPYMKQLKQYLQRSGVKMPYFERIKHSIIRKATILTEEQRLLLLAAPQEEKSGGMVSIGCSNSTDESFEQTGYYGQVDPYMLVKPRVYLYGILAIEEPIFIKARHFHADGKIDAPKGAVIVAEEFHFGDFKVSNLMNCHFIQVPKAKLDDSLTINED